MREDAEQGAKGKRQRGAAQPAKGRGKGQRGAGQAAQALKKNGFNTFCFEFIGSKAMLMCAVQHPSAFKTAQGLRGILNDFEDVRESAEYQVQQFFSSILPLPFFLLLHSPLTCDTSEFLSCTSPLR